MAKKLPPVHPGEILREEFLVPLKLTPYAVAAALHVPRTRIERIAREEKPVTADTALRLGKFFKTGAAFWMNIQARFDLETADDALAPQIRKIVSYESSCERCKSCDLLRVGLNRERKPSGVRSSILSGDKMALPRGRTERLSKPLKTSS